MIFPGTEERFTSLQFLTSPFQPFLKIGVIFLFFQSLETSPDSCDFSSVMESVLCKVCFFQTFSPISVTCEISTFFPLPHPHSHTCPESIPNHFRSVATGSKP